MMTPPLGSSPTRDPSKRVNPPQMCTATDGTIYDTEWCGPDADDGRTFHLG
jgi:hypothetical protein